MIIIVFTNVCSITAMDNKICIVILVQAGLFNTEYHMVKRLEHIL